MSVVRYPENFRWPSVAYFADGYILKLASPSSLEAEIELMELVDCVWLIDSSFSVCQSIGLREARQQPRVIQFEWVGLDGAEQLRRALTKLGSHGHGYGSRLLGNRPVSLLLDDELIEALEYWG